MIPTISVAIATYNGAKYIDEQLQSIAAQTSPPDCICICDDRSTDTTLECVERFKQRATIPVLIQSNARQLGVIENFLSAFRRCETDYIAYCDQDDVWRPDKIAICREVLQRG